MKVKVTTILIGLIKLFMIMKLGYVKLLGNWIPLFSSRYDTYPECVIYCVLLIMCLILGYVCGRGYYNAYLRVELLIGVVAIAIGCVQLISKQNVQVMGVLSVALPYMYILLAYPIFVLLRKKYWQFDSMLKSIVFWGTGAYLLKAINSLAWYITGSVIWEGLISNETWILNNSLRINPPNMGLLIIPICYYFIRKNISRCKKILYGFPILVSFAYTILVHQARSVMIYQAMTLLIMFIFEKANNRKKLIRYGLIILAIIIVVNTSYFENLIYSFSPENAEKGKSTVVRFNAIAYFGALYLNNPICGNGFLLGKDQFVGFMGRGKGHLADIGIMGSLFMLGVPLLLVFIMIIFRGYQSAGRCKRVNAEHHILLIGATNLILMTCINISCFDEIYAFAMPFYISIVEYLDYETRMSNGAIESGF